MKEDIKINLRIDGKLENDQLKVAEELANHFSPLADDIGGYNVTKLQEQDFEDHTSIHNIKGKINIQEFGFRQIKVSEVRHHLKQLNIGKTTGWDSMSAKILKMTAESIAESLTSLYDNCIKQGQWPSE